MAKSVSLLAIVYIATPPAPRLEPAAAAAVVVLVVNGDNGQIVRLF